VVLLNLFCNERPKLNYQVLFYLFGRPAIEVDLKIIWFSLCLLRTTTSSTQPL